MHQPVKPQWVCWKAKLTGRTVLQGHSGWEGRQALFSNQKICILYLKSYVVLAQDFVF